MMQELGERSSLMRLMILTIAFAVYTVGVSAVYAGGCHSSCADGYTYSKEAGGCVKITVDS